MDQLLGLTGTEAVDNKSDRAEKVDQIDICPSDEEVLAPGFLEDEPAPRRILDSDDEEGDTIGYRKRKRVLSDDEESGKQSEESEEEDAAGSGEDKEKAYDTLFDKKGRLRKDFFEAEAELSGSDEEVSDDEDERGMDRYGSLRNSGFYIYAPQCIHYTKEPNPYY